MGVRVRGTGMPGVVRIPVRIRITVRIRIPTVRIPTVRIPTVRIRVTAVGVVPAARAALVVRVAFVIATPRQEPEEPRYLEHDEQDRHTERHDERDVRPGEQRREKAHVGDYSTSNG